MNQWWLLLLFSQSCPTLWPHELQHARLPCPSLSPRICSNSHALSQWCHPIISSSVAPSSSHPQSFPASGSFPMNWINRTLWGVLITSCNSGLSIPRHWVGQVQEVISTANSPIRVTVEAINVSCLLKTSAPNTKTRDHIQSTHYSSHSWPWGWYTQNSEWENCQKKRRDEIIAER